MVQKLMTLALGLSLIALTACGGGGRKLTLNKTLSTGKDGNAKTQNDTLNKVIDSNKVCLPLYDVLAQLKNDYPKDPFVIYIQTRTLVDAGTFADDTKLSLNLVLKTIAKLVESVTGENLTSSVLIGNLLSPVQTSCDQVSFPKPGVDPSKAGDTAAYDVFTVDKSVNTQPLPIPQQPVKNIKGQPVTVQPQQPQPTGAPRRLTLLNAATGETRDYRIDDGAKNLIIDVTQVVSGGESCKGTSPAMHLKTRYTMNLTPASAAAGMSIGKVLANLLVNTLNDSGNLSKSVTDAKQTITPNTSGKVGPKTRATDPNAPAPGAATAGGVPVIYPQLELLSNQIEKQQFKVIQCK